MGRWGDREMGRQKLTSMRFLLQGMEMLNLAVVMAAYICEDTKSY